MYSISLWGATISISLFVKAFLALSNLSIYNLGREIRMNRFYMIFTFIRRTKPSLAKQARPFYIIEKHYLFRLSVTRTFKYYKEELQLPTVHHIIPTSTYVGTASSQYFISSGTYLRCIPNSFVVSSGQHS